MNSVLKFTSGGLWRGQVRRACMALDLDYQEEKGWLDSFFVVRGPKERLDRLENWLREEPTPL